jgi:nucleotide-binding universal stress UspA family protein
VATDFSPPSLRALQLASRWFAGARLTVFHAYTPPGAAPGHVAGVEDAWRGQAVRDCEAYLAEAGLPDEAAAALQRVVEPGQSEALLPDFVASAGVDLVVLGSEGRSGLARALLGSTAENLLHALDCDTLVVRGR